MIRACVRGVFASVVRVCARLWRWWYPAVVYASVRVCPYELRRRVSSAGPLPFVRVRRARRTECYDVTFGENGRRSDPLGCAMTKRESSVFSGLGDALNPRQKYPWRAKNHSETDSDPYSAPALVSIWILRRKTIAIPARTYILTNDEKSLVTSIGCALWISTNI